MQLEEHVVHRHREALLLRHRAAVGGDEAERLGRGGQRPLHGGGQVEGHAHLHGEDASTDRSVGMGRAQCVGIHAYLSTGRLNPRRRASVVKDMTASLQSGDSSNGAHSSLMAALSVET